MQPHFFSLAMINQLLATPCFLLCPGKIETSLGTIPILQTITSEKELGGWILKMDIFADVQHCIYADMGGSGQVQNFADVI